MYDARARLEKNKSNCTNTANFSKEKSWVVVQTADASKLTAIYSGQGVYLAGIELLHKIRKAQFLLGRFRMQG